MERKLAHIELIESLSPIVGADKIEVAKVLGWECVVKKDEFKVGDKIIFVEVDSVMPKNPEFEFLKSRNYRIRTIKLKGQISQGLILPLSAIDSKMTWYVNQFNIGEDVTEILGITKYLTPSERDESFGNKKIIINTNNPIKKYLMRFKWYRKLNANKKDSSFPYWVSKTDEERIQNIPYILEQYKDEVVYITEKVDYQSVTFTSKDFSNTTPIIGKLLPKKHKFVVCSRNQVNNNKNSLYWKIAEKYKIEDILKQNPNLTIQGEQGSTSVQGNKYGITEPKLWVFNIYDHDRKYHYNYTEMLGFCMKYNLTTVPYINTCKLSDLGSTVQELVEYSKGRSIINPKVEREGVVVRLVKDGRKILSFKIINPEFLLKHEN